MKPVILTGIPFKPDIAEVLKVLRISDACGEDAASVAALAEEAVAIGDPKAIYGISFIEDKGDDYIKADGVKLTSRILRMNLDNVHRIFPYIITCGTLLEEWSDRKTDLLEQYWAGAIKQMALNDAVVYTFNKIRTDYGIEKISHMNPGSLENWPVTQQRELFSLLGDPYAAIGVKLTESCLMLPVKSVSGIIYESESGFKNCILCPRETCPNRQAPFDRGLLVKYTK